ncbi:unnamed protein product [Durusdinium trenchii]|uniref:Uncharacterized protein n=1 Tax=Durusdinium trenchii TaxID=1381693 RepID=A0ABP0JX21_9DINO
MVIPKGIPAIKTYDNGRHVLKGPPPSHQIWECKDIYQQDEVYSKWVAHLVECAKKLPEESWSKLLTTLQVSEDFEPQKKVQKCISFASLRDQAFQSSEASAGSKGESEEDMKARILQEAQEKLRKEEEEKALKGKEEKSEMEARLRREMEEKLRKEAEEQLRKDAEEKLKKSIEEKLRKEAEERLRKEAEERLRKEAEEKAQLLLAQNTQSKTEAEEKLRKEAEEKAQQEAEERLRKEAEEKLRKEAEEKAQQEAKEKAKKEEEEKAQQEAEKLRKEAEEKAQQEAEERLRKEDVMKYKADRAGFTWQSSSLEGLMNEAASFELLVSNGIDLVPVGDMQSAAVTCLVGLPGGLVASKDEGRVFLILAVGTLSFLGWEMEVVGTNGADGFACFQCCRQKRAASWHSVADTQNWLAIPFGPKLQNRFGPLLFQQSSRALPLIEARIQEGLSLTVAQCKIVLGHYGQEPKSKTKADLYKQVIALVLSNEEEQKAAFEKSDLKKPKAAEGDEDEDLSELEDLLDHVEDAGNLADPDIKAKMKVGGAADPFEQPLPSDTRDAKMEVGGAADPFEQPLPSDARQAKMEVGGAAGTFEMAAAAHEVVAFPAKEDEEAEKRAKKSTPAPKYHESPHHLLDPLAPPGAKITLSTMDHRWIVTFKAQSKSFMWQTPPYSQKSYSKRFTQDTWQSMLQDVHEYAWQKWSFAAEEGEAVFSLKGKERQTPGKLDADVCLKLADWVVNLPPPKKYHRANES